MAVDATRTCEEGSVLLLVLLLSFELPPSKYPSCLVRAGGKMLCLREEPLLRSAVARVPVLAGFASANLEVTILRMAL